MTDIPRARDFHLPGRSAVYSTRGVAATSHPIASKVAVEILEAGGNAVDAAIAAAVVCGIGEPAMTGIGGDMFCLIHREGEEIVGLNASGRAPAGLSAAKLRAEGMNRMAEGSPHAITVPGAVDGFCRLAADHGRLGLDRVLAPAIRYAEEGIPVHPRVAHDWKESAPTFQGDAARKHFLKDGKPLRVGEVFRAPGQAEVLRRVAREGRAGFYEGEVAEDMVSALSEAGGTHTLDDFAKTACDYVDPISGGYRGTELVELPPNGQGATAILLAKILAQFDVGAMDPFGAKRAHLEAEATKLAYDARNRFIADPEHAELRLDHMLSDETAKKLAGLIDPERAMADPAPLSEAIHKDTIYLTVVDGDLMKVSLIYSIFHGFGSGLASDRFGILFQNRGAGFVLTEGHPNEAGAGKRPMHTIIPAMMRKDGLVNRTYGVMGGAYQPCGHVRMLSNFVDFGMEPQAAVDAPRCFYDAGELRVERGYALETREELARMGHKIAVPATPIGGSQLIEIDRELGVLIAASDPRKDGCALGL